uniref:BolA family member 3 n=1 Tax=Suricata suricatta TaxID=37032 RepID=A0A673UM60_SURSU
MRPLTTVDLGTDSGRIDTSTQEGGCCSIRTSAPRDSRAPSPPCAQRMSASQTEGEPKVTQILQEKFPQATAIKVTDISGGTKRSHRDARIADIYLRPQTLTTSWLRRCCCLRPWMNLAGTTLS